MRIPIKGGMAYAFQDQMQMRIVCPGRVSAMATSPDALYCVAAVEEKIHVWQVHLGFPVHCGPSSCKLGRYASRDNILRKLAILP